MSEYSRYRRERDWGDDAEDRARPRREEETYRDGSVKNECWSSGEYTKQRKNPAKAPVKTEKQP